ncbi:MAG TPA: 16S rRNA (cytosine(967)-C(5))-methyltransferase RsmB [Pyrinomonadaceae bacterium]|nr:16S rRNA (cytosine(967)-C(5))-methyltransferase RsmB [Pyrinomonadaceae bacterium]
MKISPARIAAFEILTKIETEKAFSSVLLPNYEAKLPDIDKGLCHEITLGVLRKRLFLDAIIEKLTNGKKLDAAVKIILRIALYQLKFLDKIPAHAAINDAVNQTQKAKKTSAKGFVNAILRRFTRENIELSFKDEVERISIENSHPRWLIERWISEFGFEETEKLTKANNETPNLDFRFTAKTTEAVRKSLENGETDKKYLFELAENGKIYFQDKASQLVAEVVDLKSSESFFDVCCAPGSKFSMVNYLSNKNDKLFVGGDLYEQRLKIVRNICEKTGTQNYSILAYDAESSLPFADESFDVVLLDAPCSGTGTIRHNPEIRYFISKKDFAELSLKQRTILKNASKLVKHGGRLIYSTCSLETEENELICKEFLAENDAFYQIKPNVSESFLTAEGFARTFPQRDKMDGFFIAAFAKK